MLITVFSVSAKQVCIDADEALARKIQIDLDEEYARTSQEQLYSGVSPPLAGGVVVAVKEFDSWNDKDHWGKDRPLPADRPRRPSKKGRKGVDTVRSVMGFERGRRSRRNDKESGELFGGLWANPGHKGYEADGESDASDADSDKKEPRVTIE